MKIIIVGLIFILTSFFSISQTIFDGDGSSETGFVPPPKTQNPPPPPANLASAETLIPYPPPPAQPQARSEKKNPPSPPIMFVKLKSQYGMVDWASRPNDLNNLLKDMKKKLDVNFTCEAKSLTDISTDPDKNPIIYRSGHFHFSFTAAERKKIREYLLSGGMLVLNTGMGSKPFFDSAKFELSEIFPETKIQRLTSDHPIFHAYYDIGQINYRKGVRDAGYIANEPLFYGVTIDCRTIAIISRWCMATGWDALDDDSVMGYSVEDAQKLGINILSYATSQRAWAKTVTHSMTFIDQDNYNAGKIFVAQIIYDGEWKTRHSGLSVLLQQFNRRTDIPVKFGHKELRLSDPKIFDAPIIYITGHEGFQISDGDIKNLREYLNKGGFLIVEACCGRNGFTASFMKEIKKVLPSQTLTSIPLESTIFTMPNFIKTVEITPALTSQLGGKTAIPPILKGIDINGQLAVVFSQYGMCGGWEMFQNPYAIAYSDSSSLAIGENILMYALTH